MNGRFVRLLRDAVWTLEHPEAWGTDGPIDEAREIDLIADAIDAGDTHEMVFELVKAWPNKENAEVVLGCIEEVTGKRGCPGEVIP